MKLPVQDIESIGIHHMFLQILFLWHIHKLFFLLFIFFNNNTTPITKAIPKTITAIIGLPHIPSISCRISNANESDTVGTINVAVFHAICNNIGIIIL